MADKNEFDDAASSVMLNTATAIRDNVYNAVPQNPAQVAQHAQIATKLGIPLESVQSDPAVAKQQAAMQGFDAHKVVTQYPHLAQFLTDQTNAAKSHNDLQTLAATEQSVKSLPAPAPASAAPNLEAEKDKGVLGWLSENAKSIPDLPMAGAQGLGYSYNRAAKALNLAGGAFPTVYDKAASLITGKDTTNAQDAYFKRFVEPLDNDASAFQLSPNATFLQKLTHGVGGLVGTLSQIALTGGMSEAPAVAGAVDAAVPAMTKVGEAVAHATKSMAFPAITAAVNSGNDVYEKTGSLAAAVKAATAAYATNTAMGVMPLSMNGSVGTRLATGFPVGVITGEANRVVNNAALPGSMQAPAGVEDAIINGLTGSMLAGAMGHNPAPHEIAVREMYEANRKANQASEAMQGLQALGELSAKSELRKNDPQAFKDFVAKVTEDGHLPEVWIDGKTLEGALAQAGIARAELVAKMPELAAQMHEASETGGDVKIDTADFATHIAGTPIEAAILPHLKTDPEGMTFSQGQEHLAQSEKDMTVQAQGLADKHSVLSREEFEGANGKAAVESRGSRRQVLLDEHNALQAKPEYNPEGPRETALSAAVNPLVKDARDVLAALDHALATGHADLAAELIAKLDRLAEQQASDAREMNTTPGVPESSPKFNKIKANLEARQAQLLADANAMRDRVAKELASEDGRAYAKYLNERAAKGNEAARDAQLKAITDDVQRQLEATGRFPKDVSKQYAALHGAFYDTMSERRGITPAEMRARMPLTIKAEGAGGLAQSDQVPELVVQHNLTAENLLHAKKMGGIAVPSLAITKGKHPLTGFGEITLLGNKDLADPKGYAKTKVFGADIYSPRYPGVEQDIDRKMLDKVGKGLEPFAKRFGMYGNGLDANELSRNGTRDLERNPAVMAKFLADHGVEPAIVDKPAMAPERLARFKKFGLDEYIDSKADKFDLIHDKGFRAKVVNEAVDAYSTLDGKRDGLISKLQSDEDTQYNFARSVADEIIRERQRIKSPEADRYGSLLAMEKQIADADLGKAFKENNDAIVYGASKGERIFQGFTNAGNRKYIPHTLDNVVKILKTQLRGGEGVSYGVGSLRAHFTPEFKSLDAIRKSKSRLVSPEEFEAVKKEIDSDFENLREQIDLDGKLRADTLISVLEEAPKLGLERAAKEYGIDLNPEAKQSAVNFLNKLRELPTAYFEAKVVRPVDPLEFKGAVVPHDVDAEALQYLKDRGITDIRQYQRGDEAERAAKIGEFGHLFFQGEGNRGSYHPSRVEMGLLKNADLSTFLHESGHFFLEAIHDLAKSPEAPQGIKDDFDTLLKDFKIEGATPEERMANWSARDLEGKREGHEKFADGFEDYLMTGKAPTPELQSLFSRFRSWLMSVYQSMRGEVSPEVRDVMDRMFASQEAITEAERVRAYAIPDLAAEHGPLIDEYKALGKEATEAAIAEMQARSLRDMKWASNAMGKKIKELQRTAKDERAKITEEVTKEVMAEPINQARTWLTKGETTTPNGDTIKVEKGFKLNTDALREMFPKGELGAPDVVAELKGLTNKEGMHPDLVADMFGFGSGKELIGALTRGEKASDKIKGLTDQRMLERHGDLIDPVSVQRAAEAAIHNEARAKMMATGLKMFTKSPMSVNEINKAAKAAADTAVAAKAVGELRPSQYGAAETKANKALLKLAPKDPAGAAKAQREALLNNRLFKSASEAVADVRKGLTYLKRLQKPAVRGKIDVDVRDQIDAILARFDLRANPTDTPTRAQVNLEKWIESQAAAGYAPTVSPEMLATEYRKPYREMTVEEFRGMVDTIKSMEHMGRERNTLMINGEKHALAEYVLTRIVPKLQEKGDNFSTDDIYTKREDRGLGPIALHLDKVSSWLRGLNAQLKPQEFKRNDFDRHELLGPFGEAIFDPVFDANYNKVRMLKGLSDDFRVKAADLGKDWQKSLLDMLPNDMLIDKIATQEAGQPVFMKLTRGKLVGLAIHGGNESNFDKLTKGYGWEPTKVWEFLHKNMTAKDWEAVQHVWDLYEKHWPDMQAMYRRLGQTTPDKIEPRAFKTPFGEMRGGYAAIKYDPLRSKRGEKDAAGAAINPSEGLFGKDYFSRTATTNGSMNKRIDGYTDAIDLNFHTIERSLQESIHDLAYREALINANKVIENAEFRKAFFKAYGREDYAAMQDWIGRIANSDNSDRNVGSFGRFLQYTRTGMVMTAIALRATTVLKHGGSAGIKTLGYFTGGGEKFLASRMASMGSDYSNQIESAKAKFGEINARLLQQDRDYRATASSMFEPESVQSQAERFGHAAVAWSDMMTAVPTAWAAYDRAITEGIPKSQGGTGQPMTEAQAVAYANKVVREAHGSNVESARSNIMTAPSEGVKLFTTLYGFMNNSYGQMADSINKFMTPGLGKPEILARTFMAIIVPALWAHYLTEGAAKHEESWAVWAAKAIAGEVAGMVPVVRDAWSMAEGFSHAGVVGAESWMSTMVHAGKDVLHLAQGKEVKKPIQDISDAVGMGLHIPGLGQLGKSAQYLSDVSTGKAPTPAGTVRDNVVVNTMMGAPKKD
jgi:hypothetical protein